MVRRNKNWWVSEAHMYSRQVGELRDQLEKEIAANNKYKHEAAYNAEMVQNITAKTKRFADIMETLVNALAQHEGHDELVRDTRVYLNILINGQEEVKPFENYFEWRNRQVGD